MVWLGISIALLATVALATLWTMVWARFRARRQIAEWVGITFSGLDSNPVALVPDGALPWSDRSLLRSCADELRAAGFLLVGTYRIESAGIHGLFLAAAVHPEEGLCALVYEHPIVGIGCEAVAELPSGASITVSNFQETAEAGRSGLHQRVHRPGATLTAVLAKLRDRVAEKELCPIDADRFPQVFESIWTRGDAWQKRHAAALAESEPAAAEAVSGSDAGENAACAPLFEAIEARDLDRIREIVEADPLLEGRDARNYTPLMAALSTGHWVLAAPIARAGADLNARAEGSPSGETSLSETFAEMRQEVESDDAKRFIEGMGSMLQAIDGHEFEPDWITPMTLAIATENAESVEGLLDLGASWRRIGARSPLSLAVMRGDREVVEVLIAGRADLNEPDRDGMTPLMHGAREGHLPIVECLVTAGADVDARLEDGEDAIELATEAARREIVEYLAPRAKRRRSRRARRWLAESAAESDTSSAPSAN